MPMPKVLIIAIAEFEQAIRSKAFLIGLLAVPLLMTLSIGIQALTARRDVSERRFAILDHTGVLASALVEAARAHNAEETRADGRRSGPHFLPEVVSADVDVEQTRLRLSDRVRRDELFAFVEIPKTILDTGADGERIQYYTEVPTYQALPDWLRRTTTRLVSSERLARLGVERSQTENLLQPLRLDSKGLLMKGPDGSITPAADVNEVQALLVPAVAMFLLFGLVMSSAPQLLNAVIEEKTSRISEVLLGSVSAFELMLGKLLGSLGVSLTFAVVYLGSALVMAMQVDFLGLIPWRILPWFALFLVMAVVLYGAIFIAIGAACSEMKDAQGMMMPALVLAVMPIFLWLQVMRNPDSLLSVSASIFPFAAPYLMLLRIALPQGPPLWQILLAVAGTIVTTIAIVWAAGRILRVGLLMQGKTASYREMARWITAK